MTDPINNPVLDLDAMVDERIRIVRFNLAEKTASKCKFGLFELVPGSWEYRPDERAYLRRVQ